MTNAYITYNAYQVAEIIQCRFQFNEDGEVVGCKVRQMSDILGSDWACGRGFDNNTPADVFYNAVRAKAQDKYGELPF